MTRVSVALLNYNGIEHLQTFLPSVVKYSDLPGVEICLIDNGSTDDSVSYVREQYLRIKIVQLDKNYGFAGGYNKGLKEIKAQYFVLLNTDVEVTGNWIMPAVHFLDKNKEVSACQPKVLSYRDKTRFEHAGASGGFIDFLGYPFCRGRILEAVEEDKGQYDDITDVFWATGACLFVRTVDFFDAGGFDDNFFAHMEEIDLCWRLKARGKRISCVPQSVVYHLGGGTLNKENPHKTYLNYRNNLLMLYKNMPQAMLKKTLMMRHVLDYLSAFVMLLSGRSKEAMAVLKARSDFKKLKKEYVLYRHQNQKAAVCTAYPEMYFKSLIFNYYFLGKKTFSDFVK